MKARRPFLLLSCCRWCRRRCCCCSAAGGLGVSLRRCGGCAGHVSTRAPHDQPARGLRRWSTCLGAGCLCARSPTAASESSCRMAPTACSSPPLTSWQGSWRTCSGAHAEGEGRGGPGCRGAARGAGDAMCAGLSPLLEPTWGLVLQGISQRCCRRPTGHDAARRGGERHGQLARLLAEGRGARAGRRRCRRRRGWQRQARGRRRQAGTLSLCEIKIILYFERR